MTLDELYSYMENPNMLDKDTLEEFRLLVESYPYCSTFSFLYLYNLAKIKDLRYTSELKKRSITILDRTFLYQLVNDSCLSNQWSWLEKKQESGGFDIINEFLENNGDSPSSSYNNSYSPNDYFQNIEDYTDDINVDVDFNKNDEKMASTTESEPKELTQSIDNVDEKNEIDEDSLFTETLANIYIKQEKYDKALRIIRSISLDYPKKNIYFADQIRFLERVLSLKNGKN